MALLQREQIDEERISIIPKFLSAIECQQLIERAEKSGFKTSPPSGNIVTHPKRFVLLKIIFIYTNFLGGGHGRTHR
ncbi:unnamed protein product, partial [Adineta steineri]